eukprot:TCONS_00069740-protein
MPFSLRNERCLGKLFLCLFGLLLPFLLVLAVIFTGLGIEGTKTAAVVYNGTNTSSMWNIVSGNASENDSLNTSRPLNDSEDSNSQMDEQTSIFYMYCFIISVFLVTCICVHTYVLCRYISKRYVSQETKQMILPCIQRKPLVSVMKELYHCIVESVDRLVIENDTIDLLRKCLDLDANFSDSIAMFTVGSGAEQFSLPYYPGLGIFQHGNISDFDLMMSPKEESAAFESDQGTKYRVVSFAANLPKGFIHLYEGNEILSAKSKRENLEGIVLNIPSINFNKIYWLSYLCNCASVLLCYYTTDNCCSNDQITVKINGPAITVFSRAFSAYNLYYDITLSIHCMDWPSQVSDWEHRPKKWPSNEDVKRIMAYGCHLVPKSPENGDEKAWRISFSKNEVELSKLIPPVARMCFITIKSIRKNDYYLSKISSYSLKTIFLNTLEKTAPNQWFSWDDENISTCFDLLLNEVIRAFETKQCQHFWISDINLLTCDGSTGMFSKKDDTFCAKVFPHSPKSNDYYIEQILKVLRRVKENPHLYVQPFPKKFLKRFPKIIETENQDNDFISSESVELINVV